MKGLRKTNPRKKFDVVHNFLYVIIKINYLELRGHM